MDDDHNPKKPPDNAPGAARWPRTANHVQEHWDVRMHDGTALFVRSEITQTKTIYRVQDLEAESAPLLLLLAMWQDKVRRGK